MKYFLVFFALFATTFAQDAGKCPVKALDSYYMFMNTYGSLFNGNQSNEYYSFVGVIEHAVLYLSDNPTGSVSYSNATLLLRNGVTGKSVLAGSFITFLQDGKEYRLQIINGQKGNCSSVDAGPVPQFSKLISNLFQIYTSTRGGEYNICQGLIASPMNSIYNAVWNGSQDDWGFVAMSVLSEIQSTYSAVTKYRPLTDADKHFFTNPCPKAAENKEPDQLMKLIHGAIRLF